MLAVAIMAIQATASSWAAWRAGTESIAAKPTDGDKGDFPLVASSQSPCYHGTSGQDYGSLTKCKTW